MEKKLNEMKNYSEMKRNKAKSLQTNSGPMCLFVIVFWHRGEAIKSNGYHHQDSYIGGLLTAADRCKNIKN